ncbi:SH3 domain-containing protein, partial [Peribacillus loiseleuriae]|uniref:SH3 domain-containing protein n=1 Tax=Peribacillus loiseleuriae TaxID=1679170 RepID=UPI003CFD5EE3
MKKKTCILLTSFFLVLTVWLHLGVPSPTFATAKTQANVSVSSLNVREKPSTSSKSLGSLKKGQVVTIETVQGNWSKVPYGKKYGWVSSSYLTKVTTSTPTITSVTQKTGYVTVDQLNVRQSASSIAKSIAKVNKGTSVTILSNSDSWSKITIPSLKLTGWVASSYITDKAPIGTPIIPSQKTGYVTVDQLNVRQSASSIAKSIAKVNKGTSVTILSNSGSWSKITIPSLKLTGWVASSYITDKAPIGTPII